MVSLSSAEWQTTYPMDFYANESLGGWTVNNEQHRPAKGSRTNIKTTIKHETAAVKNSSNDSILQDEK